MTKGNLNDRMINEKKKKGPRTYKVKERNERKKKRTKNNKVKEKDNRTIKCKRLIRKSQRDL